MLEKLQNEDYLLQLLDEGSQLGAPLLAAEDGEVGGGEGPQSLLRQFNQEGVGDVVPGVIHRVILF